MNAEWHASLGESWGQFTARRGLTEDLVRAKKEAAGRIVDGVRGSSDRLLAGLDRQSQQLSDGLADLDYTLQAGFGNLMDGFQGVHDSLESLLRVARTPAQTAAYEHFEVARDAFRRELYEECLESLDHAIAGDRSSPGYKLEWRFHHLVGVVRLGFFGCEESLADPEKAEQAFLKAARYSRADAVEESARCLMAASWAAYVQGEPERARGHAEAAAERDPDLAEASYLAAKYCMALGAFDEGVGALVGAIAHDPGYVLRAAADADFQAHEAPLDRFFEHLRGETRGVLLGPARALLQRFSAPERLAAEVADHAAVVRARLLVGDGLGLVATLRYADGGLEEDSEALDAAWEEARRALNTDRRLVQLEGGGFAIHDALAEPVDWCTLVADADLGDRAAFSRTCKYLATATAREVVVYDVQGTKLYWRVRPEHFYVKSIAWAPAQGLLGVAVGHSGCVLLDVAGKEQVANLGGRDVRRLAFSGSLNRVAWYGESKFGGRIVQVLDLPGRSPVSSIKLEWADAIALSCNGSGLLVQHGRDVALYHVRSGRPLTRMRADAFAVSPAESLIACSRRGDREVVLLDHDVRKVRGRVSQLYLRVLTFSDDGRWLAGLTDHEAVVIDVDRAEIAARMEIGQVGESCAIGFAVKGFAQIAAGGRVLMWHWARG